MPRRRLGRSPAQRIALLHAIAHIELNAIDLAWDVIARFGRFPHRNAILGRLDTPEEAAYLAGGGERFGQI